jgi:SAM-dependent methyltransferase
MHDTAYELGSLFFATYLSANASRVLDVGSQDVNGTLRNACPTRCAFTGIDLSPGPGVDLVLTDAHSYPFRDNYFDIVVSTSCFEHDQFFWLTFIEVARVTKFGGFIYINCPSNGNYHGYPLDHWRFYPDAGLALEAWSSVQDAHLVLVESFIAFRKNDIWNDYVMVYFKGMKEEIPTKKFMSESYDCCNVRRFDKDGLQRFSAQTEDRVLLLNGRTNDEYRIYPGIRTLGSSFESCEARIASARRRIIAVQRAVNSLEAVLE